MIATTMLQKVAAENPSLPENDDRKVTAAAAMVVVREYEEERDKVALEELEKKLSDETRQRGKPTLVFFMGDPLSRVRHFPSHIMLVAEYGEEKEIVGVIMGCIKTVTRGGSSSPSSSAHVKLAYLLGLRVSQTHRRLSIGTKLVQKLEEWCKENGAQYSYMATDCANEASINLFTRKCSYTKFRTPTMLVQPVHAHYKPLGSGIAIVKLPNKLAESIYRKVFAKSEFFPKDIDLILSSKLNLGTFMAMPKKYLPKWDPKTGILPPNFAMLSVWNNKEVFKLQLKGVSTLKYACCVGSRVLDAWMPWLQLPSFPNVFRKFGVYLLYGLHMEGGKCASRLMKSLCAFVHNMGVNDGECGAVVAEAGPQDPVRESIPHWRRFSWAEDLWCIKKLTDKKEDTKDWIKSRSSSPVIFVDPRDF